MGGLLPLSPANAEEAKVTPDLVRFGSDIDPIVRAWKNWGWVNQGWQSHMLAAAFYSFVGADAPDTDLTKQVRETVRNL